MELSNWFDIGLFFLLFALFVFLFASITITNLHKVYFMFHFSMMLWPLCQFVIRTTTSPTFQLFYVSIAFVGLSLLGVGLLAFTIFLTDQSKLLRRKIFLMLFVPALLTALSVVINPGGAFVLPLNGGYVQRTYGSLFWFLIAVLLSYFFVSLYLMFRTLASDKLPHIKNQVRLVLVGFLVLIGFSLADLFVNVVLSPKHPIMGLTSLGIFLSDIFIIVAIRHYKVFDIMTIAHQDIIDTISYGILVLDENEAVIEVNRALRPFVNIRLGDHFDVEASLSKIILSSEVDFFLQAYQKHQSARAQIEIKQDESNTRYVTVLAAPIMSEGIIIGRIITFQDVSQLHRLVEEKNSQNQILQERNQSLITIQDELYQVNQKLEQTAITDSLTGCYNRGYLTQRLEHEMIMNVKHHIPFAIYLLDIDFFKSINDRYGHLVGDEVICSTVEVIKHTLRRSDILVRYGGEEFLIYLPHINQVQAEILAERVKTTIEMNKVMVENGAHTLSITISMGVLSIDASNDKILENPKAYLNELFASVDGSLYQAKKEGRNRIVSTAR
jgi:two-component system cell cycle response regulator